MGIRINENIFSLLVNRNLMRANHNLEKTFEKLSSGEKINKAGDDPAGLANSHALRVKINGFQRNLINCNEGINILGVAESALGTSNDIIQRLRELAIQASNDTMGDTQRLLIQEEVTELVEELDRIGSQTNYNDKALLDGTFQNLRLQVGTRIDENIPISIEDCRASALGAVAQVSGATSVDFTAIAGTGDLTINGFVVPASVFDEISTVNGQASAIAKATAINRITHLSGVRAEADPLVYQEPAAQIQGGFMDGVNQALIINGVNIGSLEFDAGDAKQTLREQINGYTSLTGVTATVGSSGELVLTAPDGRNVEIETVGSFADELGLTVADGDINQVFASTLTLTSTDTIEVGGTLGLIGFGPGQTTTYLNPATALNSITMITSDDAQDALERIDVAQKQLLARRAALGAIESRVNVTIDNLMVSIENLSASDSRIRDADFAVETANLTQAQIIQEAGISILSQANVIPRTALSLLQQ